MDSEIAIGSLWQTRDGRQLRVKNVVGRFVVCEVLNATANMRKKTTLDCSHFDSFNEGAFCIPARVN